MINTFCSAECHSSKSHGARISPLPSHMKVPERLFEKPFLFKHVTLKSLKEEVKPEDFLNQTKSRSLLLYFSRA